MRAGDIEQKVNDAGHVPHRLRCGKTESKTMRRSQSDPKNPPLYIPEGRIIQFMDTENSREPDNNEDILSTQ